ncbi:MAG: 3D domain-containing protein [Desulfitobacteriaceae bacterium]
MAPEMPILVVAHIEATTKSISRGEPAQRIERRVMRISAYTAHDKGMDGRGITASGEQVEEGRTIAAPDSIPFGTQIYIPALDKTFTVIDRGGAIQGDRLDLYMENRKDALEFGVQELDVWVRY